MSNAESKKKITYEKLFWLFIVGSLIGVVFEGFFCLINYGAWETHVVSMWGPFCIIYGIGAAGMYIGAVLLENKGVLYKFTMYAVIATIVEYICGALLKYGLNMEAWNYDGQLLNIDGIVCLKMSLMWGLMGVLFASLLVPPLEKAFLKLEGKGWKLICALFSVFMAVNLSLTAVCILRWAERRVEAVPNNSVEAYVDKRYDDAYMQERFCEWRFLDTK